MFFHKLLFMLFFFLLNSDHRDLHVLTHPFPTRRSSDLPLCILFSQPISPASLLRHMDHVYVVTSQMGFEALLHGVPVTCFGMPWYAGWGVKIGRAHV